MSELVCPTCHEAVPDGVPVCPRDGTPMAVVKKDGMPTRVGEYVLKGIIGEGGMGVVYEGLQPVIGKRVAIKLLKKDFAQDPVEARRLLDEAKAVNQIGHRGIIDIFSFGALPDGRQYFVMEYMVGVPLSQHIREHAPLVVHDVLQILDEMLAALGAAHNAGVIHRDLKPSNIFLVSSPDGSVYVKVLDFGLAKQSPFARGETPQTRVSRVLGTPEFMAPEQARAEPVGPRTDLYALGVVAYEMLTGRLPFEAGTAFEIVNMHLNMAPKPPSVHEPSIPPEVDALVLKLMEKVAGNRPPAAEVVRTEIKRLRKVLQLNATRLSALPTPLEAYKPRLPPSPFADLSQEGTWTDKAWDGAANSRVIVADSAMRPPPAPDATLDSAVEPGNQPERPPVPDQTSPEMSTLSDAQTVPPERSDLYGPTRALEARAFVSPRAATGRADEPRRRPTPAAPTVTPFLRERAAGPGGSRARLAAPSGGADAVTLSRRGKTPMVAGGLALLVVLAGGVLVVGLRGRAQFGTGAPQSLAVAKPPGPIVAPPVKSAGEKPPEPVGVKPSEPLAVKPPAPVVDQRLEPAAEKAPEPVEVRPPEPVAANAPDPVTVKEPEPIAVKPAPRAGDREPTRAKPLAATTGKTSQLERRYRCLRQEWAKARQVKPPEDVRIFDAMLNGIGKQLNLGDAKQTGDLLDEFGRSALGADPCH